MPTVSVIMPAYNAAGFIEEAINSVRQQTKTDWELLVIDDGSTDNTAGLVESLSARDARIKLIKLLANSGSPAIPRNEGIVHAGGRFITFLDADDLWHPEKLSMQIEIMLANKLPFSCTGYRVSTTKGDQKYIVTPAQAITYRHLLLNNPIGCSTVAYDSTAIGKPSFSSIGHEDYALWLRLAQNNTPMAGIGRVLTTYRLRDDSVSANKWKMLGYFYRIYRTEGSFNVFTSLFYTIRYASYALILKILRR